ncbi:MAG: DUF5131 family protein [Phycisphaerales bacterium]
MSDHALNQLEPEEFTKISWCDHTANAWWGCTEVHTGCAHCYARAWDARTGGRHWGAHAPRRMIGSVWGDLDRWNRHYEAAGSFGIVFCSSMSDVFEDVPDSVPVVDSKGRPVPCPPGTWRSVYVDGAGSEPGLAGTWCWTVPALRFRLLEAIPILDHLRFMLLTKRPQNVTGMVPGRWLTHWPENVAVGTSVSDQRTAREFLPSLLALPRPRFLSVEPLLGRIEIAPEHLRESDLVLVGCESLPGGRLGRTSTYWGDAGFLIEQCRRAGTPVHHKQWPAADGKRIEADPGACHVPLLVSRDRLWSRA